MGLPLFAVVGEVCCCWLAEEVEEMDAFVDKAGVGIPRSAPIGIIGSPAGAIGCGCDIIILGWKASCETWMGPSIIAESMNGVMPVVGEGK